MGNCRPRLPRNETMDVAIATAEQLIREHQWRSGNEIDDDWRPRAGCHGMDRSIFFAPERKITDTYYQEARGVCSQCEVAAECLAEAVLEERGQAQSNVFGVRGGLIPRERIGIALRLGLRKGERVYEIA
jgi:hypothetical protein